MSRSFKAFIECKMLSWARSFANTPLEIAAKAAGVSPERLIEWESGDSQPTVRQLHLLAKKYRLPFAVFYLSDPPDFRIPKVRDFRSLGGLEPVLDDYILLFEIRDASEKREIILEYQEEQLSGSPKLPFGISIGDDSSAVSAKIRESLAITMNVQFKWRETRIAFNALRDLVEGLGIMVLQTSALDLSTMRGFSLDLMPLPVIVVNRKDAYAGRSFTLFHELTHICLQTSALCNLQVEHVHDKENQAVEIFCNSVAAQALVPNEDLLSQQIVVTHGSEYWNNVEISDLSRRYGSSREVIVRRLLELGLTTKEFYESKREEYQENSETRSSPKGGYVPPAVNISSLLGRRFITTLFSALDQGKITPNDFSDYAGIKLKHFDKLRAIA